ncbi:MAG: TolC family protein [Gemmataceae bacterium]
MRTTTSRMLCLLMTATLVTAGCTRRFFRDQADNQVEEILTEKDAFAPWKIDQWHVYPDPHARFADPTNPDRPPKPFDDPAANYLSPDPQKAKDGVGSPEGTSYLELLRLWDEANRLDPDANKSPAPASSALPPATKTGGSDAEALRTNEKPFRIRLEQASELGVFNSREYQDRREDLYLSALGVSLQRFSFASQFFLTEEIARLYAGSKTTGGPQNRWSGTTQANVNKLFPTGALLLFKFANQLVFEMSGNGPKFFAPSTISLDFTQPLLRGGGKAVTLEPLTQSERNLLYNVRNYARFRQQFYVSIAGGTTLGIGAPALGASFPQGNFVDTRLNASSFAVTTGYLPTLLRYAILTNERNNVAELERILTLYRALQGGGDVSPLQTDQVEQQLLTSRSTVLLSEQNLRDSLDRFKIQLGIPTAVPIELDDTPVRVLTQALLRLRDVYEQDRAVQADEKPLSELAPERLRARLHELVSSLDIVKGTQFQEMVAKDWKEWESLTVEQIDARLADIQRATNDLNQIRYRLEQNGETLSDADQAKFDALEYRGNLGFFELALRGYEAQPWKDAFPELKPDERKVRAERLQADRFRLTFVTFVRLLGTARDERIAAVRKDWPKLPSVCVDGVDLIDTDLDRANTIVAQTALTNRWDLMNARGELVDAWRQVAVTANSLLGVADVRYHLDSATPPLTTNPYAFHTTRTRSQLSLNLEAPLTRRVERNVYRTALIDYQRERRRLQFAEDTALLEVRGELRQLRVIAENYKIQQRQLKVTYSRRDSSLETFRAPSRPGEASNAVANTQNLLDAQSRVPQTENALYQLYINYLITRLQLYRDLQLMPLDPRGVWTDECAVCPEPSTQPSTGPADASQPERLPAPRAIPPEATK